MFFFPIGDTPNPEGFTPWMNWLLIALNIAVYLGVTLPLSLQPVDINAPGLQDFLRQIGPSLPAGMSLREVVQGISAYDLFTFVHGYKPGAPALGDLFLSLFLHGGLAHLCGNMLFLWIYGDNVEHRLGRLGYLVTYLGTGVAATLCFALFAGHSMAPLIGASGAISGVLGMYYLLFPRNQVKVFVFLFPFFMNTVLLPARLVLGVFIVIDNLLPFVLGAQSGVAYGAHIGGFMAGLVVAWAGEQSLWQRPWKDPYWRVGQRRARDEQGAAGDPFTRVRAAIADGVPGEAVAAVAGLDQTGLDRLSARECVSLSAWLEDAGHPVAAQRLLRGCLARRGGDTDLAEVYLALGLMRLRQGQPTAAYQYLLSVFDYDPRPQTAERAREALAHINIYRGAAK